MPNLQKGYWTNASDFQPKLNEIQTEFLRIKVKTIRNKEWIRIDYAPNNYKVIGVNEFIQILSTKAEKVL